MPRASLLTKLLVAFLLVVLPVLGLLLVSFRASVERQQQAVLDQQFLTAQAVAVQVDDTFDGAIGIGTTVANDPRARRMDPHELDPYLQELVRLNPSYTEIHVFDAQGVNRGWGNLTEPAEPRLVSSARPYFQRVMATNAPTISEVVLLRRPPAPAVVVAVPIRDDAGQPIGVVKVVMRADLLAQRYRADQFRPGQAIFVADPTGRLALHTARPNLTFEESSAYADLAPMRTALAGTPVQTVEYSSPLRGDTILASFVPTPRYHWVTAVTIPRSAVLEPIQAVLREQLTAFTGILVLSVALAVILARFLVSPVRQLERAVCAMGRGDLTQCVRIETGDELERLGDSINQMAAQLAQRQADVVQLRTEAEHRARQLAAVIASVPDAVFFASADGRLVDANPAALRMLGSNDGSMLGHPLSAYLTTLAMRHSDGRPLAPDEIPLQRALDGEIFTNFEVSWRSLNDEERITMSSGAPIRDETGQIVLGVVVARDITEARRAQEALRQVEERLHTVVSNAPIVLFAYDRDGIFTLSEGRGLEALGLRPGEAVGRSVFDLYRNVPSIVEHNRRALSGESFVAVDEVAGLVFETRWVPLRDQSGSVSGAIGVATDISERRRAEEEREGHLAREQALARIGQALVTEFELERVTDAVIDQSLNVLGTDQVALWLADPARRQLDLLAWRNALPSTVATLSRLSYDAPFISARTARSEQVQVIEDVSNSDAPPVVRQIVQQEGARSLLSIPLCSRQRLIGVVTYVFETPRHFSQRDLEFNRTVADLFAVAIENARLFDEVRNMLRLREEFISAAAHELKTPVTTIKGWVEVLQRDGSLTPRQQTALAVLSRQAGRIARLIDDLLVVARVHPSARELRRERFDLNRLVQEQVQQTNRTLAHHGISFDRNAPLTVDADYRLIREVIVHLFENALRYSSERNPIEVEAGKTDGEVVVSVRDHGVGIRFERQPHVFEPFYEPVPHGTPGYVGVVSLGLYVSKQIVEAHGGRIWLESQEGKGSTFSFSLPLAAPEQSE